MRRELQVQAGTMEPCGKFRSVQLQISYKAEKLGGKWGGAEGERRAGKHLTLPFTANKRCYKYTNCISVQLACLGIKSK